MEQTIEKEMKEMTNDVIEGTATQILDKAREYIRLWFENKELVTGLSKVENGTVCPKELGGWADTMNISLYDHEPVDEINFVLDLPNERVQVDHMAYRIACDVVFTYGSKTPEQRRDLKTEYKRVYGEADYEVTCKQKKKWEYLTILASLVGFWGLLEEAKDRIKTEE